MRISFQQTLGLVNNPKVLMFETGTTKTPPMIETKRCLKYYLKEHLMAKFIEIDSNVSSMATHI